MLVALRSRVLAAPRRIGGARLKSKKAVTAAPSGRPKSLLVDGNNVLHHFFDPLSTVERDGVKTGAVDGVVRLLRRLDLTHRPAHICVFFDSARRPTTRKLMAPNYKRGRRPTHAALRSQFGYARDVLRGAGIHCFESPGFEADDLIASYTRALTAASHDVIVVSNDNDFLQLVRDGQDGSPAEPSDDGANATPRGSVQLYQPSKRRYLRERNLTGRFGLRPALLPDMYALCGDRWGKVPRVVQLSEARAIELLNEFGGLFPLLRQLDAVEDAELRQALKHGISAIETSHRLARLNDAVALPLAVAELQPPALDRLAAVVAAS